MTDTAVDGGGVVPDQPLVDGARIRFRLHDSAGAAVNAFIEDGELHVVGQYRPIHARRAGPNHLVIEAAPATRGTR